MRSVACRSGPRRLVSNQPGSPSQLSTEFGTSSFASKSWQGEIRSLQPRKPATSERVESRTPSQSNPTKERGPSSLARPTRPKAAAASARRRQESRGAERGRKRDRGRKGTSHSRSARRLQPPCGFPAGLRACACGTCSARSLVRSSVASQPPRSSERHGRAGHPTCGLGSWSVNYRVRRSLSRACCQCGTGGSRDLALGC